jgi:hypothetical protein
MSAVGVRFHVTPQLYSCQKLLSLSHVSEPKSCLATHVDPLKHAVDCGVTTNEALSDSENH